MSVEFKDMPWLVTVTPGHTYGPQSMAKAVELRDGLRVVAPVLTVEAWAAGAPDSRVVRDPEQAFVDVVA